MSSPRVLERPAVQWVVDYVSAIRFAYEVAFLAFVLSNAAVLTGAQWYITQSTYSATRVFIKNAVFLYVAWRIIFLAPGPRLPAVAGVLQILYLTAQIAYFEFAGMAFNVGQAVHNFGESITAVDSLAVVAGAPAIYLPALWLIVLGGVLRRYREIRRRLMHTALPAIAASGTLTIIAFSMLGYFDGQLRGSHHSRAARTFKYGTILPGLFALSADEAAIIAALDYGPELTIPGARGAAPGGAAGATTTDGAAVAAGSNIVTVQVESLNADVLFAEYEGQPVMPRLAALAEENIYYPYMVAQHKAGNSSDAEFSVLNGIEAVADFPASQFSTYEYPNAVPARLTGYARLAFHGNYGDYFNRFETFGGMGFDAFLDQTALELPSEGWGASDEAVYDAVLTRMAAEDAPFLYHVITMTSHGPFDNYRGYYEAPRFAGAATATERDYLSSMQYVDETLAAFVAETRATAPDTWIFLYGDHTVRISGEEYRSDSRRSYRDELFEFVPLVIVAPDGRRYREGEQAVSFLDLAPTILAATGTGGTIRSWGESLIRRDGAPLDTPLRLNGRGFDRDAVYDLME